MAVDVVWPVAVVEQQPAVFGFDRQAVRADALRVPIVRDAAQLTRGHDNRVIRPRVEIIAVGDPDVRATAVEDGVTPVDLLREQHVIFVLGTLQRGDILPRDEVIRDGDHRVVAMRPIGGIAHVEAPVERRHARVFHAAIVAAPIVRGHDRLRETVPRQAVHADGVADRRDEIHALCAIVHVEETVVLRHRAVEDVHRLPTVERVGVEQWALWVAFEFKLHECSRPVVDE